MDIVVHDTEYKFWKVVLCFTNRREGKRFGKGGRCHGPLDPWLYEEFRETSDTSTDSTHCSSVSDK